MEDSEKLEPWQASLARALKRLDRLYRTTSNQYSKDLAMGAHENIRLAWTLIEKQMLSSQEVDALIEEAKRIVEI